MRARLAWVAGAAGVAGVVVARRLRGRRARPPATDPAGELRRKLDESRALAAEREEFEAGETTVDRAEPAAESVEERRRRVHEHGRRAAEEMRGEND